MFKKFTEIRNNILISKRLRALIVIIALVIVTLGVFSVRSISTINNKITEINNVYLKSMIKLSGLIENIYSILIESHIIDENSLSDNAIDNTLNIDLLSTYLNEFESALIDDTQKSQYKNFVTEFQLYTTILKEVNSLEFQGKYDLAKERRSQKEIVSFKKLQSTIKSMMEYNAEEIRKGDLLIKNLEQKISTKIIFISFLLIILAILTISFLLNDLKSSLRLLTTNLSVLKSGEIPEQKLSESENEIGSMAQLINSITGNLASLNKFANDISKGIYSSDYSLAGERDLLGKALVNLRNNLRVTKEEDERRKLEEERRNWTNKGHALFGEILRQRSRALNQLTDDIIKNLVYYLNANQGGLFLINDTGDISKIELISAFAYDRKKFFERTINIGDGLIGTVALERNTIYLKEIPEDYIEIESGLGDATPKCLLIVPLKFEDEILGIVEIASFKELEKYEIKFVEEVAQSIASTLLTAKINARTEQLLEESRKQSEELTAQEIEARQNMEEMRATQELAQRREADLTGIISAVDNTLMKGEYELDGTLISVNNRHLQTMGYQLKEIKGKNIEMFIPTEELEHFRKVWASVIAGNPRQLEVRRRTKTGEILWLINQYTPVTDVSGKISKVLYLAHDITKYKKSEEESFARSTALEFKDEELKSKLEELKSAQEEVTVKSNELNNILNAIGSEQVIIEFDLEGKIIAVNQKFEKLVRLNIQEIKGKTLNQIVNTDKTKEETDKLLAQVMTGSSVIAVNKYTNVDEDTFWLKEYYTPIFDARNLPYKIISIAIDITQLKLTEEQNLDLQDKIEKVSKSKAPIEDKGLTKKVKEYQIVYENIDKWVPKAELDAEFNFISVNDIFVNELKFTIKDLIEKPVSRIIGEESKETLYEKLDKLGLEPVNLDDVSIVAKDKSVINYNLKLIPYGDKKAEKLIVYFLKKALIVEEKSESEDSSALIENKVQEIKTLEAKIEKLKKKTEELDNDYLDSDIDKLYDQWLDKLKDDE